MYGQGISIEGSILDMVVDFEIVKCSVLGSPMRVSVWPA